MFVIRFWWIDEAICELLEDEGGQLVAHLLLPWLRVVRFGSLAVAIVSALLIVLQCHGDDGSISDMSDVLIWE